jgi:hypothetical protein
MFLVMDERDLQTLERILHQRGGFSHREHLELVWNYLDRYDADAARDAVAAAIRHVATLHGAPERYHETITQAWVRLVALHRNGSAATTFDEFIADNAGLLDRALLARHYTEKLIASDQARRQRTEPDLRPLPAAA